LSKKILLVDDDPDNTYVFGHILERSGYKVIKAKNGLEAVSLAEAERPDLILMDMQLPVMSGYEATEKIKKMADVPVIALTAHAMPSDMEKALKAGCDDYIAKPIEYQSFMKKIEGFFRGDSPTLH
jgi:CheY-like chemotaxis protein